MIDSARAGLTVLVVEDNAEAREVFAFSLRTTGYAVTEADNGRHALDVIRLQTPAAIMTDLRMPEMNGIEFAKALQDFPQYASIPIVLITATPLSDKWEALSLFAELLIKPCTLEELVSTIDKVCGINCN